MGDSRQIHRMDCYDDYGAGNFYYGAAVEIFCMIGVMTCRGNPINILIS